ncbi:MAG: tyrosine-type recombinase/integrase [Halobacteriota archaeon]
MKNITDYMEKEQVQTLLDYAQACSSWDYLMLRILWRTGMRISELLSIRPQDLEAHNQVVNITKAKGNKQRRVMLDTETFAMLSTYISNTNIPVSRPVFAFSSVWAWKLVKKYARMAGLSDTIHPHTLRHSYAVRMVRSGTDMRSVQLLLGHSNLNTTQVYLQFKDEDLRAIYNAVEF